MKINKILPPYINNFAKIDNYLKLKINEYRHLVKHYEQKIVELNNTLNVLLNIYTNINAQKLKGG